MDDEIVRVDDMELIYQFQYQFQQYITLSKQRQLKSLEEEEEEKKKVIDGKRRNQSLIDCDIKQMLESKDQLYEDIVENLPQNKEQYVKAILDSQFTKKELRRKEIIKKVNKRCYGLGMLDDTNNNKKKKNPNRSNHSKKRHRDSHGHFSSTKKRINPTI